MSHGEASPAPKSPVRARQRALRTEEILAEAERILATEGVDALTVHRLARELQYVPAALYRYFPSMELLVAELVARAVRSLGSALSVRAQQARERGADALGEAWAGVEAFLEWARQHPSSMALISRATADPRVLIPLDGRALEVASDISRAAGPVMDALERAVASGLLNAEQPAPLRAALLFTGVHGAVALRKVERVAPGVLDMDEVARTHAALLFRAFGANPLKLEHAQRAARLGAP